MGVKRGRGDASLMSNLEVSLPLCGVVTEELYGWKTGLQVHVSGIQNW